MHIEDYAQTLVQLPIVAIFIGVVFHLNKTHREEREKANEQLNKLAEAVSDLNATVQSFHTEIREWRREARGE